MLSTKMLEATSFTSGSYPFIEYLRDDFNGSNGASLSAHTMNTGSGWTENTGVWTINSASGVEQSSVSGDNYIATADAGVANYQAILRMRLNAASGNGAGGLVFRYTDTNNYFVVRIVPNAGWADIIEKSSGTEYQRASVTFPAHYQVWDYIELTCSGSDITATVDGGFTMTYSSAFNKTATRIGMLEYRTGAYQGHTFDGFQVVNLPRIPMVRNGDAITATVALEGSNVYEPFVMYDTNPQILTSETNVFKIWYSADGWGTPKVCYAESTNGKIWSKYSSGSVVSGHSRSSVVKSSGSYYLYTTKSDESAIDLYTSANGISFSLSASGVIVLGPGTYDDQYLGNSCTWIDSGSWFMLYDSIGTGTGKWGENLATSTNGRNWTKSGSNPVLIDTGATGSVWVTKDNGYYYMWLLKSADTGLPTWLFRYRSSNLTSWQLWPYVSFVKRLGSDEGENTMVGQNADPCLLTVGDKVYIYYAGSSDGSSSSGNFRIKLITADKNLIKGW